MINEKKNPFIKKIEELKEDIKEAIQEGQSKLLIIGLTFLFSFLLGFLVIADRLSAIIQRIDVIISRSEEKERPEGTQISALAKITGVDALMQLYQPVSAYNVSSGSGLSVTLDTGGRPYLEVWVKSSSPAEFNVYSSKDGQNWRKTDTIVLETPGEKTIGYINAYRWIRVKTEVNANNEIEISASR